MDAMLNELCSADAAKLCDDVVPGEGRVQECLRTKRDSLSWDCQEELFRQEVENADDLRLNYVLFRKCSRDKQKYCADLKYGNARVKECLEVRLAPSLLAHPGPPRFSLKYSPSSRRRAAPVPFRRTTATSRTFPRSAARSLRR